LLSHLDLIRVSYGGQAVANHEQALLPHGAVPPLALPHQAVDGLLDLVGEMVS
jgi:hypothetical protein